MTLHVINDTIELIKNRKNIFHMIVTNPSIFLYIRVKGQILTKGSDLIDRF